jgi:hypothetical protein
MFKAATEMLPGGKAAQQPDSHFDQHELKLGIEDEMEEHGPDDKVAKEISKDHLMGDPHYYSKMARDNLDPIPNKEKNQDKVESVGTLAPGGQNPGGHPLVRNRSGKGSGGDDNSREYWDMDFTGKKAGFMSIGPPKENVYPAEIEAVRTMEDLMDLDVIFPRDYNPEWGPLKPSIGPTPKHRNERNVAPDPIKDKWEGDDKHAPLTADDDANIEQKQVQPLVPNQKMAIAVDPKGPAGERIVIMTPLFEEASPAIMALRSHQFERHGAVVVDGPPEWLLGITPQLEALDKGAGMVGAEELYQQMVQLVQRSGLTIEYTQEPRP